MATKMVSGQYLAITATPTQNGVPGGVFMNPVVWTHNADALGINGVTLTCPINPGDPDTVASLFIPNVNTVYGTFSVTATSGTLIGNTVIECVDPTTIADGMILVPGNPQ